MTLENEVWLAFVRVRKTAHSSPQHLTPTHLKTPGHVFNFQGKLQPASPGLQGMSGHDGKAVQIDFAIQENLCLCL